MNCNEIIFSKKILLKEGSQYIVSPGSIEITGNEITNVTKLTIQSYQDSIINENKKNKIKTHDFGDQLISPAFINSHTHIAMNFFRAFIMNHSKSKNLIEDIFFKCESLLNASDVRAFARIGAYENILNGNGLIWDHYYHGFEVAEACRDVGISAVISPTLQDISGPGLSYYHSMLDQTYQIHSNTTLRKSGIYAAFGPHATDTVSGDLWTEIKKGTKKLNIPIHCHVSQTYDEVLKVNKKFKKSPIEYLYSLGILKNTSNNLFVHGIYLTDKDFKLLKNKHCALVFCPFSQMIFQSPANVMEWYKNKIKWFVATDCVASNDSMNLQKEIRFVSGFPSLENTFLKISQLNKNVSKKSKKISFHEINHNKKLQNIFSNSNFLLDKILEGPGSFHNQFIAGAIKKGALANLIVWTLDHPSMWPAHNVTRNLTMGDTTGAIYNMCVAGKWLGENGNYSQSILNSTGYRNSLEEANQRLNTLIKRL